jgi:transglutaminase-like putative cysteine protease
MSADARRGALAACAAGAWLAVVSGCAHPATTAPKPPPAPATTATPAPAAPAADLLAPRSFVFTSTTTIPAGAAAAQSVDAWIPLPRSNGYQEVTLLQAGLDEPDAAWRPAAFMVETTSDAASGNAMLHLHLPRCEHPAFTVSVRAQVVRRQASADGRPDGSGLADVAASLRPDRLVPLDGRIAEIAASLPPAPDDEALAREVFEEVRARMTYDKVAPGWGQGDALRACEVGKGNCTDFHALFIGLARARGLPARFSIGYSLPEGPADGSPLAGYHCWAEFHSAARGWVPVDASEADKRPELADAYYGRLTTNRIALTSGRDVQLAPPQRGPPLNYFLKPYAERDGAPLDGLAQVITVRDA